MKRAIIKIPASTSNLGSGFDTLGLAVALYTRLEVEISSDSGVRVGGELGKEAPTGLTKLFEDAAALFFQTGRTSPFGIEVRVSGDVPIARGLGYSATLRVGLMGALNEMSGKNFDRNSLLNVAAQLEGHPDNASPSIFGGFTVSGTVNAEVRCLHFPVPQTLKFVTLVPDFPVSTEEARKLMPQTFSKADTVHSLNRAALITAAFASGDLHSLRGLFDDRVHQPYREKLISPLRSVIQAGEAAGALGGFLSGSGSAIICLAVDRADEIGAAMQRVMPEAEVLILAPDNRGFVVE
jgi:homoserine kinase